MGNSYFFSDIENKYLYYIIAFLVLFSIANTFYPLLTQDDPLLFANIAKHIYINNDWVNLKFHNNDWLDKPHFLFWMTAISYKIFGVNSFAYIFPGLIFYFNGAYFTFLLANRLFTLKHALVSVIIYFSSFHLMLSAYDVRAEVYIIGELMPACYFWYLYYYNSKISYLLLGAIFSSLAVMTKGIFLLIPIFSGVFVLSLYTKNIFSLFRMKWILAYLLIIILSIPEIYTLYLQFDLHPEKFVFNKNSVSGVKWFLVGSQIGRFFNNGEIVQNNYNDYFYFLHTLLWAILPWTLLFITTIYTVFKNFRNSLEKETIIYILGSILPIFIIFSISSFKLDHYINIIIPFISILSAIIFMDLQYEKRSSRLIYYFHIGFFYTIFILVAILNYFIFGYVCDVIFISLGFIIIFFIKKFKWKMQLISYAVFSIIIVMSFLLLVFSKIFIKYEAGYQISKITNRENLKIIDYKVNSLTLNFYTNNNYAFINNENDLLTLNKPFFLITDSEHLNELKFLPKIVYKVQGTTIDKFAKFYLNKNKFAQVLKTYYLIRVDN